MKIGLRKIEFKVMGWIELGQHIPLPGFHTKTDELLGSIKTVKFFLLSFLGECQQTMRFSADIH
jgi:hypothetical protein